MQACSVKWHTHGVTKCFLIIMYVHDILRQACNASGPYCPSNNAASHACSRTRKVVECLRKLYSLHSKAQNDHRRHLLVWSLRQPDIHLLFTGIGHSALTLTEKSLIIL